MKRDVVLHVRGLTGTGGGPDKTILLSAAALAHTNYWLAAAYMHPPADPGYQVLRARAVAAACPLVSVPDRGPVDLSVLRGLLRLCRSLDVRIWHGHDYKSNLFGLLLRPFHSMELVSTVHGWVKHTRRTPLYYAIDRQCLRHYQHVICVSDDLLDWTRRLGVLEERSTLIHNGIDEYTFRRLYGAAQSPLRARYGTPASRMIVGAVGRLSPEKGFDVLVEATALLVSEGLDFEVWIVGEGDSQAELQELIDRRGLRDRVRLLGFVDDTIELYHALDMFVLSSVREGLPNVVLEALAMGVPVVSTSAGSVARLIRHEQTGLLCLLGDVESLAAAMQRMLRDQKVRETVATAGRALVERQFSFTRRMAMERDVYDQVLGIGRPRVIR